MRHDDVAGRAHEQLQRAAATRSGSCSTLVMPERLGGGRVVEADDGKVAAMPASTAARWTPIGERIAGAHERIGARVPATADR